MTFLKKIHKIIATRSFLKDNFLHNYFLVNISIKVKVKDTFVKESSRVQIKVHNVKHNGQEHKRVIINTNDTAFKKNPFTTSYG